MKKFNVDWLDSKGTFSMRNPQNTSGLYFPIAGESGMKSVVTPNLGGDAKCTQNTFLTPPMSIGDLHTTRFTRNFWVQTEKGAWSATGNSAETEALKGTELQDDVTLTAGLMWHQVKRHSPKYGLSAVAVSFVPCDENPVELLTLTLTNETDDPMTVTPITAIPLYCRSADNIRDHRHVTSLLHRSHVLEKGLEITPTLTFDERGHCVNTKTYYVLAADETGTPMTDCCPCQNDFVGEGGSLTRPEAVFSGTDAWKKPGDTVDGEELIAAFRFAPVTLAAGESKTYIAAMGICDKDDFAGVCTAAASRYLSGEGAAKALSEVKEYWTAKNNVRLGTGDAAFDNFMSWVSFQPILRRIYGCSFLPYHDYGKGGRGWRDLWQDCLALIIMEPDNVRRMLVNDYRGVRFDGTNATIIGEKEGEFLADRNGIPRVWMDHGFWPFLTTEYFIHFTGDDSILLESVPYFKDNHIRRCEAIDEAWETAQGTLQMDARGNVAVGTVLEHILVETLTACYDVGEHGTIRLRGADWNDGLDMAVQKGESVTFTAAYAGNVRRLAGLLRHMAQKHQTLSVNRELNILLFCPDFSTESKLAALDAFYEAAPHTVSGEKLEMNLEEIADKLEALSRAMEAHIRANEWVTTPEGSFYNGYYDDEGKQLEGLRDDTVRMTLTGQVFPIMSGLASAAEIESITAAADKLLFAPQAGGYRLNTDFGDGNCHMGRAFAFSYGHKENGAVFCHMATMFSNALYTRGFTKAGYKAFHALYSQTTDFARCRSYPGIPEYFDNNGRGLYPYLTGTASWMLLTVMSEMFGVKCSYGDIRLAPQLLRTQLDEKGCACIRFVFNGTPVCLEYTAAHGAEIYTAVQNVTVNGKALEGTCVPKACLTGDAVTIRAELV